MIPYAIIRDAGPPVDSAAPEVTKRPVPKPGVSTFSNNLILRENSRRTDRASNGNHLHMTGLQLVSETRVGCSLSCCLVIIFSSDISHYLRWLGDVGIGIPFEAVDKSSSPISSWSSLTCTPFWTVSIPQIQILLHIIVWRCWRC
jgi:hypothetical protein